jgi:hypothetical protein
MQSILPEVTAARPSATVRSKVWVRSERSASFDEASRITCENLSTMDWMRGRPMSRQACAEPITGPTRLARSRTIVNVAGGLCAACDTEQHGPNQQDVAVRGHGKLLENKITVSRFSGIVSPPTGLWGSALWRSRIRLLAPLHELFEQLAVLFGRRRRARRRGGEQGLELVDCGLLRGLDGWRQRVLERLCEVGEPADCSPSLWRDPGTATTKNSATSAATPMAAAKRAATVHNAFFDSRSWSCMTSGSRGWRSALDTALSSWESNDTAENGFSRLVPRVADRSRIERGA